MEEDMNSCLLDASMDFNSEAVMKKLILTRSSAIAEEPRDASCQLKSCQLPHNNNNNNDRLTAFDPGQPG